MNHQKDKEMQRKQDVIFVKEDERVLIYVVVYCGLNLVKTEIK